MESVFKVNGKDFKVKLSFLGMEQYEYDGRILERKWSLKQRENSVFHIDGSVIEVAVSVSFRHWSVVVLKDGQVYVEELFPEMREKVMKQRGNQSFGKWYWIKTTLLWLAVALTAFFIFRQM